MSHFPPDFLPLLLSFSLFLILSPLLSLRYPLTPTPVFSLPHISSHSLIVSHIFLSPNPTISTLSLLYLSHPAANYRREECSGRGPVTTIFHNISTTSSTTFIKLYLCNLQPRPSPTSTTPPFLLYLHITEPETSSNRQIP